MLDLKFSACQVEVWWPDLRNSIVDVACGKVYRMCVVYSFLVESGYSLDDPVSDKIAQDIYDSKSLTGS